MLKVAEKAFETLLDTSKWIPDVKIYFISYCECMCILRTVLLCEDGWNVVSTWCSLVGIKTDKKIILVTLLPYNPFDHQDPAVKEG